MPGLTFRLHRDAQITLDLGRMSFANTFAGSNKGLLPTARPACKTAAQRARHVAALAAVKVGDKAPDFELPDQTGKKIKLSSFQGWLGKPVVLYFYPSDGSPSCTKQANAFKDSISSFKKAGAEVIGVSSDDVASHVEFRNKLDLPFPLLADQGGQVRSKYGVPKDLLGLLEGRQTYVIAKDGTVKLVFNSQFSPEKHPQEALAALNAN